MNPIKVIPLSEMYTAAWGKQGENNAVHLSFDLTGWGNAWPDGAAAVAFRRADGKEYAHAYKREGNTLLIPVLNYDTEISGSCAVAISWLDNGNEARSVVIDGRVNPSIVSLGETPTPPEKGVIEQVNAAAANAGISAQTAADAAQAAETAAKNAQESLENMEERYYVPNVDNEGNLSFTPTSNEMTAVPTVNIRGPQGIQGIQGEIGPVGPAGETGPQGPGIPDHTAADAGKILYIAPDGNAAWLKVGNGLKIENGTLMLNLTTGDSVSFSENADGSVSLAGVVFTEQDDGSVLLENATFTAQADGSVLIQ